MQTAVEINGDKIWLKVINATGGCISWRECSADEHDQTLAELKRLFSGPGFRFETADAPPDVPEGGFRPADPLARKIRFTKNIT